MQLEERLITPTQLKEMSDAAWQVRRHAYIFGPTRVGAAVMTSDGSLFVGCNVEHRFRSHDIHAEVNAIGSMVAAGHADLIAVVVVAEREQFTPCGACMDWIYQFGGPSCVIGFQASVDSEIDMFTARDLMPHYPTQLPLGVIGTSALFQTDILSCVHQRRRVVIPEYVCRRLAVRYLHRPIVSDPARGDIAPTCVAHYAKDLSTRLVADGRFPHGARPYTVREYARLQGVPDTFTFAGSDNDAYRMIGNGVSVPVGKWIGAEITRYFQ